MLAKKQDRKAPNVGARVRKRRLPKYKDPDTLVSAYYRYLVRAHARPIQRSIESVFTKKVIQKIWEELSPNAKKDGVRRDADALTVAIGDVKRRARRGQPPRSNDIETVRSIEERTRAFAYAEHERVTALDPALASRPVRVRSRQFRKENIKLITSIADTDYERLDKILRKAIREGARVETLAKVIEERFVKSTDAKGRPINAAARARLIARDQVLKHNGQMTKDLQKNVGISKYIWRTSDDERVRDAHAANDGLVFSWENPPVTGHPGDDFQCRCHAEPVLEDS